jgi:hypothetical protein
LSSFKVNGGKKLIQKAVKIGRAEQRKSEREIFGGLRRLKLINFTRRSLNNQVSELTE